VIVRLVRKLTEFDEMVRRYLGKE